MPRMALGFLFAGGMNAWAYEVTDAVLPPSPSPTPPTSPVSALQHKAGPHAAQPCMRMAAPVGWLAAEPFY